MPPSTQEIRDWFGPMPCPIALPILTLADVRGMLVELHTAAHAAAQTFGDLIVALDAESVGGAGK